MTMDTSEKREPLMSDAEACSLRSDIDSVALRVRDFYEAKIASGELRVVAKVKHEVSTEWDVEKGYKADIYCPTNKLSFIVRSQLKHQCCPGCGAQIIE